MTIEPAGDPAPWLQVTASVPCLAPPAWALGERALLDLLDEAWRLFDGEFSNDDGSLRYSADLVSRDGGDDFFESFFNWPQLYLLGGHDDLLSSCHLHWTGVVAQLTALGIFSDEFEIGYDWFHQGESLLFTYFLCLADPATWRERAVRFAELYVDPKHGNYDAELAIVTAPHNGSGGARDGVSDTPSYPWTAKEVAQYGFPLDWMVADGDPVPDLADDPRLGAEMQSRLGRGDAVGNLSIVGLVLNAYLATGERRYADWILGYMDGWVRRAQDNGGLIPDNVGRDGVVGSQLDGRWYGGHYGWTWPHGMYSLGQATLVGMLGAAIVAEPGSDKRYLDVVRELLDQVIAQGRQQPFTESDSSLQARWHAHLGADVASPTLLVPYRHSDKGWFDFNPVQTSVPFALWHHTADEADRARLQALRASSGYDWTVVRPFRDKEEAGHEEPWFTFLEGENDDYPERILDAAQQQVRRRLALIEQNRGRDLVEEDIHLWQMVNPVVTEALVQLMWGGPQVVYNGGLQQARVRWFDARRRRPGLPREVAVLVSSIDPGATVVDLVNTSAAAAHTVVLQAGAFAEHTITGVSVTTSPSSRWTGGLYDYVHVEPEVTVVDMVVDAPWIEVELPPSTQVRLTMRLDLHSRPPSYAAPWDHTEESA